MIKTTTNICIGSNTISAAAFSGVNGNNEPVFGISFQSDLTIGSEVIVSMLNKAGYEFLLKKLNEAYTMYEEDLCQKNQIKVEDSTKSTM